MAIPLEKYDEKLSKYIGRVKSAYLKPFRDEIRAARNETEMEIVKSPLGRKLWGSSASNPGPGRPRLLVGAPRLRFSKSATAHVGGFKVLGMAALMIKGGRTEAHLIKPVRGRFLRFSVDGRDVYAQLVRHPGSAVQRVDVLARIVERRMGRVPAAAVRELDRAAVESFR